MYFRSSISHPAYSHPASAYLPRCIFVVHGPKLSHQKSTTGFLFSLQSDLHWGYWTNPFVVWLKRRAWGCTKSVESQELVTNRPRRHASYIRIQDRVLSVTLHNSLMDALSSWPVFLIRDIQTDTILFVRRIVDPSAWLGLDCHYTKAALFSINNKWALGTNPWPVQSKHQL